MSITIEQLNNNFNDFDNYKLVHKQTHYIVNMTINKCNVKINVSKDLEYIYVNSDDIDVDKLNVQLIFNKDINCIKQYFNTIPKEIVEKKYDDIFGIFRLKNIYNKGNCNYNNLEKLLKESKKKSDIIISKIPKNVLFKPLQIIDIIIKEIKNVNSNKEHNHMIINTNVPYLFELHINIIDSKKNNMEIILNMDIDPELYPYVPPKIKYISPNAKRDLIYNFSNIKILEFENWNPTITFDWLIINIAKNLSKLSYDYIENNNETELNDIDMYLIEFNTLIGEKTYNNINLEFDYMKYSLTLSNINKHYWNSGTGFGYNGINNWDIKKYVENELIKNKNISLIIKKIHDIILCNNNYVDKIINSNLIKYIENYVCNTTLLEINKNRIVYETILYFIKDFFDIFDSNLNQWKYNINSGLENIITDIKPIITNLSDDSILPFYINIIDTADFIKNKIQDINIKTCDMTCDMSCDMTCDTIDMYNMMIKNEQEKLFSDYIIKSNHRFYKNINTQLNPKALMRITSEFSSIRKNLPINWDTSIIMRASSDNLNIFSFVITGPKDTPYHNGIYEFHAQFPANYPNSEPHVLLDTTGGGSVRFNPNLYNCGKVCLSLLGTWNGQEGESWNKDTSTFLQVLISIQSLILVDNPYFNEPGWEQHMNTEKGNKLSFEYNDNIRLQNLKWAIVDKLKNPAYGFENIIKEHFKLKKNEIIDVVENWIIESKTRKNELTKYLTEFKNIV